jgi:hypothetical protein
MICQPDPIVGLPELVAVSVHLACRDPQHHWASVPLADAGGSFWIAGQMHMLAPARFETLCPDRIKAGGRGSVKQLIRRRGGW